MPWWSSFARGPRGPTEQELTSAGYRRTGSTSLSYFPGTYVVEQKPVRFKLGTPQGTCPPRSQWKSGFFRNHCDCPKGFWSKKYFLNRDKECQRMSGRWDYSQFGRNVCYVCPRSGGRSAGTSRPLVRLQHRVRTGGTRSPRSGGLPDMTGRVQLDLGDRIRADPEYQRCEAGILRPKLVPGTCWGIDPRWVRSVDQSNACWRAAQARIARG